MLKKCFSVILALIAVALTAIPTGAECAELVSTSASDECDELVSTAADDEWEYTLDEGNAVIVRYLGSDHDVAVPSELGGAPVTEIKTDAFADVKDTILSLNVPEGVRIFDGLSGCTKLMSVTLPDTVTEIKASAFANCWSLREIVIPKALTTIENSTFYGCFKLKSVVIPDSVTSLGKYAFCDCPSLEDVVIGARVTTIGDFCFEGCMSIKQIFIPSSVTQIGTWAFDYYGEQGRGLRNGMVIKTPEGSAAQTYAENNRVEYVNTDEDYHIDLPEPERSPLNVKIDDTLIPVDRGEEFEIVFYTSYHTPIGSVSGAVNFDRLSFKYYENEIGYSSDEDGALFEGTASIEGSYNIDYASFDISAASDDPELYSAFLTESGYYIQPLFMVSASLNEVSGVYSISSSLDVSKKARDIYGRMIYDSQRDFCDIYFSWGLIMIKDDEIVYPINNTDSMNPRGDADGDGEINILDATRIQRFLAGIIEADVMDTAAADADLDGEVTILDVTRIQRFLAGLCDMDGNEAEVPYSEPDPEPGMLRTPRITKVESNNSGAVITWEAVEGAERYRVLVKNGSEWVKLSDTSATEYTHTTAALNTEYIYTVCCISADGKTVLSRYDEEGYANTRLPAPTLKKAELMDGYIGVSWDSVPSATAYRVFIKGGAFTSWSWIYDTEINYVDVDTELLGLMSDTSYSFTVRCIDGRLSDRFTGGFDTIGISVKYYDTPYIVGIVNEDDGIALYWTEAAGSAKYRVFIWTGEKWQKLFDTDDTAVLITGLMYSNVYRFTVRGLDANGKFLTPYDEFGREMKWYPGYHTDSSFRVPNLSDKIEKYANKLGFKTGLDIRESADPQDVYMIDCSGFYAGNSESIDSYILHRAKRMIELNADRIRRAGDEPGDYYCNIVAEGDAYDNIWFYLVLTYVPD